MQRHPNAGRAWDATFLEGFLIKIAPLAEQPEAAPHPIQAIKALHISPTAVSLPVAPTPQRIKRSTFSFSEAGLTQIRRQHGNCVQSQPRSELKKIR